MRYATSAQHEEIDYSTYSLEEIERLLWILLPPALKRMDAEARAKAMREHGHDTATMDANHSHQQRRRRHHHHQQQPHHQHQQQPHHQHQQQQQQQQFRPQHQQQHFDAFAGVQSASNVNHGPTCALPYFVDDIEDPMVMDGPTTSYGSQVNPFVIDEDPQPQFPGPSPQRARKSRSAMQQSGGAFGLFKGYVEGHKTTSHPFRSETGTTSRYSISLSGLDTDAIQARGRQHYVLYPISPHTFFTAVTSTTPLLTVGAPIIAELSADGPGAQVSSGQAAIDPTLSNVRGTPSIEVTAASSGPVPPTFDWTTRQSAAQDPSGSSPSTITGTLNAKLAQDTQQPAMHRQNGRCVGQPIPPLIHDLANAIKSLSHDGGTSVPLRFALINTGLQPVPEHFLRGLGILNPASPLNLFYGDERLFNRQWWEWLTVQEG